MPVAAKNGRSTKKFKMPRKWLRSSTDRHEIQRGNNLTFRVVGNDDTVGMIQKPHRWFSTHIKSKL